MLTKRTPSATQLATVAPSMSTVALPSLMGATLRTVLLRWTAARCTSTTAQWHCGQKRCSLATELGNRVGNGGRGSSIFVVAGIVWYILPCPLGRWVNAADGSRSQVSSEVNEDFPSACAPANHTTASPLHSALACAQLDAFALVRPHFPRFAASDGTALARVAVVVPHQRCRVRRAHTPVQTT
jgi:hypothetical protein